MEKAVELTKKQEEILRLAGLGVGYLIENTLDGLLESDKNVHELSDDSLLELLTAANLLYREGEPMLTDQQYDFVFLGELRRRNPNHPFLHTVEPGAVVGVKTVELPSRMLSTDKAYDYDTVERWAKRIEKAAVESELTFESLIFRATPKLDGYAAYDDGQKLYTRGDGRRGTDITRVFDRGLQVARDGERGLGPGEIVVSRSYFEKFLADHFDNSRNFQASLIKEKALEPPAAEAIRLGRAVFYPFSLLPDWQGSWAGLSGDFEQIVDNLWDEVDFDIDGVVIEVIEPRIRKMMGATRHHHRWQIAYKRNTETAEVRVLRVVAQTSRSGRVNPVAEVEPTRLSGALIKRASAHHYKMVVDNGIGPGSLIKLSRSGEVIPKIEEVLESVEPDLPESCPSCGAGLIWEKDFLLCVNNQNCPAQVTHAIEHFFKTLGNVDGFGPSSILKIYQGGIDSIIGIYELDGQAFEDLGFGPKQAQNMVAQLLRSRLEPIEDWRFLAAFGVYRMGMGNCERLLGSASLESVFSLQIDDLVSIKGFGEKSSTAIEHGFRAIKNQFLKLFQLGFNLIETPLDSSEEVSAEYANILLGKTVVFTGAMQHGSREDMKKQAKSLGAKVGSSITGKTDLLVCGDRVGAAKIKKAESLGIKKLSEVEYLDLLG